MIHQTKRRLYFGIRSRIMLVCSSLVICVIFICMSIFSSFYETLRANASRAIVSELNDLQMKIELFFLELDKCAGEVYYNDQSRKLLTGDEDSKRMNELLDKVCKDVYNATGADVMVSIVSSQMSILSSSYQEWIGKQRVLGTHWIDKINRADGEKVLISSYTVSDAFLQEGIRVISMARLIRTNGNQKGIMIIDVPVRYVQQLGATVNLSGSDFFAMLDDDNTVLYHTNEKMVGTVFRQIPLGDTEKKPYFLSIIDEREMLVSQIHSSYSGYTLLGAVGTHSLYHETSQIQHIFFLRMLFIGLLSLVMIWLFIHNLTRPLVQMSKAMRRVEKGDFSPYPFEARNDEIGYLEKSFNKMLGKLTELINREYKSVVREREAEYKVLAAGIQPHFIYNTLETISMTAYMNDDIQTMDMLNSLADLFRFSAISPKKFVTLAYECEHARTYIQLCQMRNPDVFTTEWEVDESLLNCLVLPFLLQPIVENAVKYAFANIESGGILRIIAQAMPESKLKLCVVDNGQGMGKERMNEISSLLRSEKEADSFLALKNIHDRIRLNFGCQYGLSIQSADRGGLAVEVFLPILEEHNDDSIADRG